MEQIQATLIPNEGLFLWSTEEPAKEIIQRHLPSLWPKRQSTKACSKICFNLCTFRVEKFVSSPKTRYLAETTNRRTQKNS